MSSVSAQSFHLLEPTGPYDVGTTARFYIDDAREETFTRDNPDDMRELRVDFWYPATVEAGATPAPYLLNPEAVTRGLEQAVRNQPPGLPLTGEDFAGLLSHSYLDAPVSDEQAQYPVMVFSHGWGGHPRLYTALIEEMASQGFIVAAVEHTYGSSAAIFPDGRIIGQVFSGAQGSTTEDSTIWSEDQGFVLDQLEALNADDPEGKFTGRLDLEHASVVGASFGGLAAMVTLLNDIRFISGVNIDGDLSGLVFRRGLDQPFMFMAQGDFAKGIGNFGNYRGTVYNLAFDGFGHASFSDAALWGVPVAFLGPADGVRAVQTTNAYVLAFLNQTLKDTDEPLLDGASPDYPEVTFETNAES